MFVATHGPVNLDSWATIAPIVTNADEEFYERLYQIQVREWRIEHGSDDKSDIESS